MKSLRVSLLFLILQVSQTLNAAPLISIKTEASNCINCSTTSGGDSNIKDLFIAAAEISRIQDKMNHSNRCEQFAENDSLGAYGEIIVKEVTSKTSDNYKYSRLMQGPKDVTILCPAFKTMSEDEKAGFYVLVINSMAHYESSCDKSETAKGPNGKLKGLLQLHANSEQKYSSGCKNKDSFTPETTFRCGLSMLDDQVRRHDQLFYKLSYWDVLRPGSKNKKAQKITKAISNYSPCGLELSTTSSSTKAIAVN